MGCQELGTLNPRVSELELLHMSTVCKRRFSSQENNKYLNGGLELVRRATVSYQNSSQNHQCHAQKVQSINQGKS